jgi:hypothetical protein
LVNLQVEIFLKSRVSFSFSGKGVRQPSQTVPEPMITHLSPHCGGIYPLLSSVINILIL